MFYLIVLYVFAAPQIQTSEGTADQDEGDSHLVSV